MRRKANDPESLIPLMQAEFQTLLSLADRPRHGYGIMAEIRARSRSSVTLGPGTLYGTIKRLLGWGLILEEDRDEALDASGDRRTFYEITPLGMHIASLEAERLAKLVADAMEKGLPTPMPGSERCPLPSTEDTPGDPSVR